MVTNRSTTKAAIKQAASPVQSKAIAAKKPVPAKVARPATKAATKPTGKATMKPAAAVSLEPTASPAVEKPVGKLVRDSFTMPRQDFDLIAVLKKRAVAFQRPAKKSELLRAGLHVLVALDDARLKTSLDALVALKAGRPRKLR